MKIASILYDSRINATNALVELEIGEYINLIREVLDKNEFQRKRVRSSKTVYALLKEDLLKQCVIPPIVLALTNNVNIEDDDTGSNLYTKISDNKDHLVILDGLQRTYTIIDLINDLSERDDTDSLSKILSTKLRIEIYIGLNRLGILYRMLTLNTGQTPMSLRQQIEMLYLDYLYNDIDGVELIRESEGRVANRPSQYNFKDVIEGFNAYLDRDELPIDKANLLENINSLEKLSKENQSTKLFEDYVTSFDALVRKISSECGDTEVSEDYIESKGTPFGKNSTQLLKKPQSMSGFGAAIGKMFDFEVLSGFDQVIDTINGITVDDPEEFLEEINDALLWLKNNSKKIGNAQRTFFTFFYRDLFNPDSDNFKNITASTSSALRKYQAQNM